MVPQLSFFVVSLLKVIKIKQSFAVFIDTTPNVSDVFGDIAYISLNGAEYDAKTIDQSQTS